MAVGGLRETETVRISSAITYVLKYLLPVPWYVGIGYYVWKAAHTGVPGKIMTAVALAAVLAVAGYLFMDRLLWRIADEVADCGDSLLVRTGEEERTVHFSELASVSPHAAMFLRLTSRKGETILFLPRGDAPIEAQLRERIAAAPAAPPEAAPSLARVAFLVPASFFPPMLLLPLIYAIPLLFIGYQSGGKAALGLVLFLPFAYLIAAGMGYGLSLLVCLPAILVLGALRRLRFGYYLVGASLCALLVSWWLTRGATRPGGFAYALAISLAFALLVWGWAVVAHKERIIATTPFPRNTH